MLSPANFPEAWCSCHSSSESFRICCPLTDAGYEVYAKIKTKDKDIETISIERKKKRMQCVTDITVIFVVKIEYSSRIHAPSLTYNLPQLAW